MVNVFVETVIHRPREMVSSYAADPSSAPEWYENIRTAQWNTPPPLTVGSRVAFTARFLGKNLEYVYEIVEFVPGSRLVMRTAQGPFPMQTTYEWFAAGDATRMTLRNEGEPSGFTRAAAPFVAAMMRRATTKDLENIKRILEAR